MMYSRLLIFIFLVGLLHCPAGFCNAQFVWQLNHSFSLNASAGMQLDETQPDLSFFPFEPEYSNLKNKTPLVFAYLCFVSFTSTPPNNTKFYTLSICLDSAEPSHNGQPGQVPAVVWSANRGAPVTGEGLSLTLQNDGDLVLQGGNDRVPAWSSGTGNASLGVVRMELTLSEREGANLILVDSLNKSVWQSTDDPSDTLTDLQALVRNSSRQKLTSWASRTNIADGIYNLEVEPSGIALYASFPARVPYWMWIYDKTCPATQVSLMNVSCGNGGGLSFINLDYLGVNCWVANSEGGMVPYTCLSFASTGSDDLVNRTFVKIYWDGNLRAHTLQYSASEDTHRVTLMDVFSVNQCGLPLRCGPYGVCRGTSSPQCECPVDSTLFRPVDASDLTQGCVHAQPLSGTCSNNNASATSNKSTSTSATTQVMHRIEGLDYFSNAFSSPLPQILTEEGCSNGCLQNCSCLAAFWYAHTQGCYHVEQMGSLQVAQNQSFIAFLKVNPSPVSSPEQNPGTVSEKNGISAGGMAALVVCGLAAILVLACSLYCFIARRRRRHDQNQHTDDSDEAILDDIPGLPTRYLYTELHDITKGFSSKLGKGGFGAVYLGILPDGTKVAVKQLESVKQGDKEFRSEVAIMAGIHHYNLLHLRGFCMQRAHRLLVYEYMENGSLDQWLFKRSTDIWNEGGGGEQIIEKCSPLAWDVRFKIVLGTARGLAYLHEECRERILHLDIKPQNILLDEEFVAKVADFGLSRPMGRDKSVVVTTMRGTPGYLAPEWLKEAGSIGVKCDVFSFGMLLLEVVSGRKNSDHSVQLSEKIYYPEWAYQQIAFSAHHKGLTIADDLTDAKLESNKDRAQLMNMITAAFLCIVDKPDWRPSMSQVVKMLESGEHEDHLEASRVLRQRQQQLVFVLMSRPVHSSFSVHSSSMAQPNTTSSSSNYSGVAPSSSIFSQVSGR